MPYISINNFKFGLDGRRSELSSAPGSLITAQDGHITEGGEFEQRKAFVPMGVLPAGTFGFENTANGPVVFGSADLTAACAAIGLGYVRCVYPNPTNATITSAPAMTGVLCSCCFGGETLCAAQFGSETYLYYNGTIVPGSVAGQVISINGSTMTIAQIVKATYNLLNTAYWQSLGVFVENLTATGFNIYTSSTAQATPTVPGGSSALSWQPVLDLTGTGQGVIAFHEVSAVTQGAVGSGTNAELTLYAGGGVSSSITLLEVIAGSQTYKLLTSTLSGLVGTPSAVATSIASAITSEGTAPISAQATSNLGQITITSAVEVPPGNYISVAVTGDLCFDNMALDFSGVTDSLIQHIYVSGGANLVKSTAKYTTGVGYIVCQPSGTQISVPRPNWILWIPGANETKLGYNNVFYLATDYPGGVVIDYTTGSFSTYGKGGTACTAQIFVITDIFNGNQSLSNPPTLAQIQGIASTIRGNNNAYTAAAVATATSAELYISRRQFTTAPNASNLFFYSNATGIAQG